MRILSTKSLSGEKWIGGMRETTVLNPFLNQCILFTAQTKSPLLAATVRMEYTG